MYVALEKVETWDLVKKPQSFFVKQTPTGMAVVHMVTFSRITVGCIMNFTWYPFDTQVICKYNNKYQPVLVQ